MSAPGAPQIFIRPRTGNGTISFYWDPPVSDGGSAITSYTLDCPNDPAAPYTITSRNTYEVSGLFNTVDYTYTLTATNGNGTGPAATYRTVRPNLSEVYPTIVSSTTSGSYATVSYKVPNAMIAGKFTSQTSSFLPNASWVRFAMSTDGYHVVGTNATQPFVSHTAGTTWRQGHHLIDSLTGAGFKDVTISSDGQRMAACFGANAIFTSSDGGKFWVQQLNSGIRDWTCITGSTDGRILFAASPTDGIYRSLDYGLNWQNIRLGTYYTDMACTSDGSTLFVSLGSYVLKMVGLAETLYEAAPGYTINSISISSDAQTLIVSPNGTYIRRSTNGGTTWSDITSAGIFNNWYKVAMSSDGTYLTAVGNPAVEVNYHFKRSSDSGATWTEVILDDTYEGINRVNWAEMSADGSKQLVVSNSGYIYMSTDYGVTWNGTTKRIRDMVSCCSSTDCTKLYYLDRSSGHLYYSYNSGLTWTKGKLFTGSCFLDCSDDGSRVYVAQFLTPNIWRSSDSGATWTAVQPIPDAEVQWLSIVTSSTGQYVAATGLGSIGVYYSSNYGATYTAQLPSGSGQDWYTISMSPDGTKLAVIAANNLLFTTANSGTTWSQVTLPASSGLWGAVGINSDGTKLTAGKFGSVASVFTSTNSGTTWTERTGMGLHGAVQIRYTPTGDTILVGTNDNGVMVSTDGGVNWTSGGGYGVIGGVGKSSDGTTIFAAEQRGVPILSRDTGVTWTELNFADRQRWTAIAGSADGVKLAATAYNGTIWTSANLGLTWTSRAGGYKNWRTITCDISGTKLLAGVSGEYLYTSTDSGASWTARTSAGSRSWRASASSATGVKVAAVDYGGSIWTSTDTGASWTERSGAGSRNWSAIASSSNGSTLVATVYNGSIWTSTDSGANWTERTGAGTRNWTAVCCSTDGAKIAATATGGSIWTSTDTGANWTERTGAGTRNWASITCSSIGTFILAAVTNGGFWISKSSGARWAEIPESAYVNWQAVISSSDGHRIAGCVYGESIYTSGDSGVSLQAVEQYGYYPGVAQYWSNIRCSLDGRYVYAAVNRREVYGEGYTYLSRDFGRNFSLVRSLGMLHYTGLAMSATGSTLIATGGDDNIPTYIFTSTNGGLTWTARTGAGKRFWASVACSYDGTFIVAVPITGNLYTSSDSGATWTTRTSAGSRTWGTRYGLACSATGELIYAVTSAGLYKGWNYGASWARITQANDSDITSVSTSPDGNRVLFTRGASNNPQYSTDQGRSFSGTLVNRPLYLACSIAPYANIIAAVDNTDSYRDIFFNDYQTTSFLGGGIGGPRSLALSQDGTRMYIGTNIAPFCIEPPLDVGWVVARATDTATLALTKGNSKPTIGTVDVEIHPSNTTRIEIQTVNDAGYSYYVSTVVN